MSENSLLDFYNDLRADCADKLASLWLRRRFMSTQYGYFQTDINRCDERIQSQLDFMMQEPELSWNTSVKALEESQGAEAFFAAALIAFSSLDVKKIQVVVETGIESEPGINGIVGAMAWLPNRLVHAWVKKFLTSKNLIHKLLALKACAERGEDPGEILSVILSRDDCRENEALWIAAVKSVGVFKRKELYQSVLPALSSESPQVQFWAYYALLLLGDRVQVEKLSDYFFKPCLEQSTAIEIACVAHDLGQIQGWIATLARNLEHQRLAIKATAALGDPQAVNWLIMCMKNPSLSRIAGAAFTQITGMDLVYYQLSHQTPKEIEALFEDQEPIDNLSEDAELPFPNTEKIAMVWERYRENFQQGVRYFYGQPLSAEFLKSVIEKGNQRQRVSAALRLALLFPVEPLRPVALREWGL